MGYFQVRYDSRVINYDHRGFIGLATGNCKQGPSILIHFLPNKLLDSNKFEGADWLI